MPLLIIGGSDAGISTALRARELASDVTVTVVVTAAFTNYSDLAATGMGWLLNRRG
jgi:hypothetical protein